MTDTTGTADPAQGNEQTPPKGDPPQAKEFKPITTQEEFDRAIGARVYEERSKFSDYDDLKKAKAELEKIKEADKTDLEKYADRAAAAEAKVAAYEKAAQEAKWRLEVRTEMGLPESLDVLLTGETLEEIKAKAEILSANIPVKKTEKPIVPGDTGDNSANTDGKPERPKGQVFL